MTKLDLENNHYRIMIENCKKKPRLQKNSLIADYQKAKNHYDDYWASKVTLYKAK